MDETPSLAGEYDIKMSISYNGAPGGKIESEGSFYKTDKYSLPEIGSPSGGNSYKRVPLEGAVIVHPSSDELQSLKGWLGKIDNEGGYDLFLCQAPQLQELSIYEMPVDPESWGLQRKRLDQLKPSGIRSSEGFRPLLPSIVVSAKIKEGIEGSYEGVCKSPVSLSGKTVNITLSRHF